MNVPLRAAAVTAAAVLHVQAQVVADPQPVRGALPGTHRYLVTFESRPFDLEPLRQAILAAAPATELAEIAADLDARARASHETFRATVAAVGGTTTQHWWIIDACAVEVRPEHVGALRGQPNVSGVFPDSLRAPAEIDFIKDATNSRNHNSDQVNALGFTGSGVAVAVLDSGCDDNMSASGRPHATFFVNGDINNRTGGGLGGSRLLVNRQIGSQSADDIIAHGTAVAACAAGQIWSTALGDPGQAPGARIASYSMCDTSQGFALISTMVSAWQRVAIDAGALGIRVANLSYEGSTPVNWPEQKAADAAAQVADLAVAVMAGNGGASTHYSHGALNVLAVGSVATNARAVSPFSSRGPLEDDQERFFPDVVANGQNLTMPLADNEGGNRVGSGTSYSSPQVAGAMAIYRSVRTTATSLETRAAVLASAEPIGEQNRGIDVHTRNAYGLGYLRTDRLVQLGVDPNTTSATLLVTRQQPAQRLRYRVTAGVWYVVALAWNRQNENSLDWSNLDLAVSLGGNQLATSTTPRNVHERVIFKAPANATVDIDVTGVTFETGQTAIACGIVAAVGQPAYREGAATAFGVTCLPLLDPFDVPSLGTRYDLVAYNMTGAANGVLLSGASNQRWGSIPLPLPLDAFGAPSCRLYVSPDLAVGFPVTGGVATLRIPVPNSLGLLGASLFHQIAIPNSRNALGASFSNGVRVQVAGYAQ